MGVYVCCVAVAPSAPSCSRVHINKYSSKVVIVPYRVLSPFRLCMCVNSSFSLPIGIAYLPFLSFLISFSISFSVVPFVFCLVSGSVSVVVSYTHTKVTAGIDISAGMGALTSITYSRY